MQHCITILYNINEAILAFFLFINNVFIPLLSWKYIYLNTEINISYTDSWQCVYGCFVRFLSGIRYYLKVISIYLSYPWEAPLSIGTQKSTCIDRFNQEPVGSLNFFNDTMLITVMSMSVLQPNTTFYLSKRRGSLQKVRIYRRRRRRSCVCSQYTRQDCPIGITENSCSIFRLFISQNYGIMVMGTREAMSWRRRSNQNIVRVHCIYMYSNILPF